jgi:hypothetical protein
MDARNEKTLSKATPLRIAAEQALTAAHTAEEEHQEAIQEEIRKKSYAMGPVILAPMEKDKTFARSIMDVADKNLTKDNQRRLFGFKLRKTDKEGTDAGSPKATKAKSATPAESLDAATEMTAPAKPIAA